MNDTLDYEVASPSLLPGLATGPALFAWEEHPELRPIIERNLSQKGDVEQVEKYIFHPRRPLSQPAPFLFCSQTLHYVSKSSGIERSRLLAETYADKARQSLKRLPDSDAKSALEVLSEQVVQRSW